MAPRVVECAPCATLILGPLWFLLVIRVAQSGSSTRGEGRVAFTSETVIPGAALRVQLSPQSSKVEAANQGGCKSPQPSRTYRRLVKRRRSFFVGRRRGTGPEHRHNDVAMATFLAWMDFNMAYQRTDNVEGLGTCRLIIQDLLKLDDLLAIEVGEIGMQLDYPDRLFLYLGNELDVCETPIRNASLPGRISLNPFNTRSSSSPAPIPRSASQIPCSRRAEQNSARPPRPVHYPLRLSSRWFIRCCQRVGNKAAMTMRSTPHITPREFACDGPGLKA